jgi:hypothetical protein
MITLPELPELHKIAGIAQTRKKSVLISVNQW